jgi:hypothetical protein
MLHKSQRLVLANIDVRGAFAAVRRRLTLSPKIINAKVRPVIHIDYPVFPGVPMRTPEADGKAS